MPNESTLDIGDAAEFLGDESTNEEVVEETNTDEVEDPDNGNARVSYTQGEETDEPADENTEGDQGTEEKGKEDAKEGEQADDPELAQIPHYQQIKGKYPTLFKEFPGLKTAFFFGQEMQATFGTVDQAKRSVAALEAYQDLDQKIFSGSSEEILTELHKQNSADRFVEDFLPTLLKVNRESYIKATEPVIINVLNRVFAEGQQRGDKNIINAAKILSREIFGSTEIPKVTKREEKPDPEKENLRRSLQEREQRDADKFRQDVINTGNNAIKRAIEVRLPADLSAYHKGVITRLAFEELSDLLARDQAYVNAQRPLWQGALRSKFEGDWKARIVGAALARAKQSLNSVVNKHITQFTGKAPAKANGKDTQVQRQREGKSGSAGPTGNPTNYRAKDINTAKTSALDILNDKVTLKS